MTKLVPLRYPQQNNKEDSFGIPMERMTYIHIKKVRQTLTPKEVGIEIKRIEETGKGQLLVKVQNGVTTESEIRDTISKHRR